MISTLGNEKHAYRHARVSADGASGNSTDVTNLLVDNFSIVTETGGGDSCINGNNKRHNRSIRNMVKAVLIDSNQHETKWFVHQKKRLKSID